MIPSTEGRDRERNCGVPGLPRRRRGAGCYSTGSPTPGVGLGVGL